MCSATLIGMLCTMLLSVQIPARTEVPRKARELLAKAIQAHGGAEGLSALCISSWKGRGLLYREGREDKPIPFYGEWHGNLPEQYRYTYSLKGAGGSSLPVTTGLLEGKAWRTLVTNRGADDLDDKLAKEVAEEAHAHYVSRLVPLLRGDYLLTVLPITKRDDRLIIGLKVDKPGYRSIYLFFDRQLGYLTYLDRKVYDQELNAEINQETSFLNFKSFGKLTLARSITVRRGKKLHLEVELDSYEAKSSLERKFFEKPADDDP
ncbi:MAG TPA: hypothetical protein PKD72_07360 [Gemmatales bacterium]|nr:hypothetical protein [Gemmatales bacterium]